MDQLLKIDFLNFINNPVTRIYYIFFFQIFNQYKMSTIQEIQESLKKDIENVQKTIVGLKKKKAQEKKQNIPKLKGKILRIGTLLDTFNYQIEAEQDNLDAGQIATYRASLSQFKKRIAKANSDLEYMKSEGNSQQELFKQAQSNSNPADLNSYNRTQLIDYGKKLQNDGKDALDRALRDIEQMDQIGINVNKQLQKQIQQLDRIYDTCKDTQTTLKRATTYIRYFARQVYTDKLIMCLIVLIICAIITIIILSALGIGKGNFNVPDKIA